MRIYHFIDAENALKDLAKRRLKIATFNDLNDPFELLGFSSSDKDFRAAFLKFKEQFSTKFGMLCFSRNWKNPVLWSHYADKHRGLCFGFDVPDKVIVPVTYAAKRLEPKIAELKRDVEASQKHMIEILSTKYTHWRYESEIRVFTTLDDVDRDTGMCFKPFSEDLILKEIIVGHHATMSRAELKNALDPLDSMIDLRKARLAFRSFRVVTQMNQSLW